MVMCKNCKLLQLENNFNPFEMYGDNYGYMSSLNKSMVSHLNLKSLSLKKRYKFKSKDAILDIGSNDGTFLSFFNKNFNLFGCDPTIKKFKKYYRKDINQLEDFFSADLFKDIKFSLITSISMFYDLPKPLEFAKQIFSILKNNGIWHIELSYMPMMIKNTSYDTICHEHLEYYSYNSLKYLFEKNGLKIFKMSENKINGGSYRIYCKKNIKKSIKYKEKASYSEIIKFVKRVKQNKEKTVNFIKENVKRGKKIFIYGASTKGNTLLQYYGLTNKEIPFAAERTKTKWGKYTIGSGVKILSEEKARKLKPDYFFVMPYGFIKEFIIREKKWLKSGGKFLLPYPFFKVVK